MHPLNPTQILRNLEHGYFMTHQEQSEAAAYIRQLQQENLTLLGKPEHMTPISPDQYERLCFTCGACVGKPWVGLTQEERDELLNGSTRIPSRLIDWVEQKLKEKNSAL